MVSVNFENIRYIREHTILVAGEEKEISAGPIPEGEYFIDLSLDPNRDWQIDKKGNSIPGRGIEQLGTNYPNWGTIRARLEIEPSTNTKGRDYFYFHNSRKGYSHGCIETVGNFFRKLFQYRKAGNSKIRVKVSYGSKNKSTYGKTDK